MGGDSASREDNWGATSPRVGDRENTEFETIPWIWPFRRILEPRIRMERGQFPIE